MKITGSSKSLMGNDVEAFNCPRESRFSQGSGILCLAIAGGARVPLLQGFLADAFGIQRAFLVTIICYGYIVYYGIKGSTPALSK